MILLLDRYLMQLQLDVSLGSLLLKVILRERALVGNPKLEDQVVQQKRKDSAKRERLLKLKMNVQDNLYLSKEKQKNDWEESESIFTGRDY